MNRRHSTGTVIVLLLLVAAGTLLLSFFGFRMLYGVNTPVWDEVQRFQEAREIIHNRYVGQAEESVLTDAAIAASVAALRDPWSRYLTAEQYEAHLRHVGNQQQGIGILMGRDGETNEVVILEVTPGSPAEEAGLQPGDTMVLLDGDPTGPLENAAVREVIGRHYGGSVTLTMRDEAGETRTVSVEVRAFFVNPVSFRMMEGDIGYIQIANFDLTSGEETIYAIESLREEGAVGLIFDVRRNPGGRVNELLLILDYLLPEGEIFVFADYTGRETVRYSAPDYLSMPMVVLVNEYSFSAAEFFAAILQEKDWATIVGMPTTGKGRSQVIIPLEGGGAIQLSTSRYLTPGRMDLYEVGGIRPDVRSVNFGEVDSQLERAIDQIRNKQ